MPAKVKVTICEEDIQQFCKQLLQRSRDIAKTHESLVTIEALLGRISHSAESPQLYEDILDVVRKYSEQSREALMLQHVEKLNVALQQRDAQLIKQLYVRVSRNGFYEILQRVNDRLSDEQCLNINDWCLKWLTVAKHDAEKASGYPDAYDFKKAGVDTELFYALEDISRYLSVR